MNYHLIKNELSFNKNELSFNKNELSFNNISTDDLSSLSSISSDFSNTDKTKLFETDNSADKLTDITTKHLILIKLRNKYFGLKHIIQ